MVYDALAWFEAFMNSLSPVTVALAYTALLLALRVDTLVHELAHALVYRRLCGGPGAIVVGTAGPSLVSQIGWLTITLRPWFTHHSRFSGYAIACPRRMTPLQSVAVSLAGPAGTLVFSVAASFGALAVVEGGSQAPIVIGIAVQGGVTLLASLWPFSNSSDGQQALAAIALAVFARVLRRRGLASRLSVAHLTQLASDRLVDKAPGSVADPSPSAPGDAPCECGNGCPPIALPASPAAA